MKNFLKKWNNMGTVERVLTGINMLCSAAVFVLCVLYLLDVLTNVIAVAFPLMAVIMLTQAGLFWKKDRVIAVFCGLVTLFILGIILYSMVG